jgi:hypothetical protein
MQMIKRGNRNFRRGLSSAKPSDAQSAAVGVGVGSDQESSTGGLQENEETVLEDGVMPSGSTSSSAVSPAHFLAREREQRESPPCFNDGEPAQFHVQGKMLNQLMTNLSTTLEHQQVPVFESLTSRGWIVFYRQFEVYRQKGGRMPLLSCCARQVRLMLPYLLELEDDGELSSLSEATLIRLLQKQFCVLNKEKAITALERVKMDSNATPSLDGILQYVTTFRDKVEQLSHFHIGEVHLAKLLLEGLTEKGDFRKDAKWIAKLEKIDTLAGAIRLTVKQAKSFMAMQEAYAPFSGSSKNHHGSNSSSKPVNSSTTSSSFSANNTRDNRPSGNRSSHGATGTGSGQSNKSPAKPFKYDPTTKMCFNCGGGHSVNDCPHVIDRDRVRSNHEQKKAYWDKKKAQSGGRHAAVNAIAEEESVDSDSDAEWLAMLSDIEEEDDCSTISDYLPDVCINSVDGGSSFSSVFPAKVVGSELTVQAMLDSGADIALVSKRAFIALRAAGAPVHHQYNYSTKSPTLSHGHYV